MIIPVRCFTCGNILASKYETYKKRVSELKKKEGITDTDPLLITGSNINSEEILSTPEKRVLDDLKLVRYCCRRHFISQIDIINYI